VATQNSNPDAPATKGDIARLEQKIESLDHRLETYWSASNRVQVIAIALIIAATVAIIVPSIAPYLPKPAPALKS
jgi:hypothetical protein